MDFLVAVVEIEGTTGVIVFAVFLLVFLFVGALAWIIVRNTTISSSKSTSTWKVSSEIPLPGSRPATSEKISRVVEAGMSRPFLTREQQQFVAGLPSLRTKIAISYRWGLIIAGIAGVGLSIAIYRDYRDDEMILLPVGLIFLLSLGVLLSGLIPSRTVDPIEPVNPELLKKIQVDVRKQPLTIQLDDASAQRASELLRGGMTAAEVARQIVPAYDRLDDLERREVERAIAMLRDR
jgi:hypothetical protein